MFAGGSAREKAASLRVEAAALREQAELREQDARNWDAGADGEARVGRELARAESAGWTALHDRLVRPDDSRANLDHLAVGPGGIVLVDSKNWSAGAWLHDGMLFRNGPTGPVPCRSELAHVRHDAAAVGAAVSAPVTPVLCLSGPNAGKVTRPVEIAGVHVLPVGQLVAFLRGLPSTDADVAALATQLDHAFPTACAAPPPAIRSVPARPSTPAPVRRRSRPADTRPGQPRRALVALGGVLLLLVVGPRIGKAVTDAVTKSLPTVPVPFPSPCASITDAEVSQSVGRTVHRLAASAADTCRWKYSRPTAAYYPADIEIETGWPVKFAADAAQRRARVTHTPTSEELLVPQFVAVPGSAQPGSATTQPLDVRVTVSGGVSSTVAARAVRWLAVLTERHMPVGPGATRVAPTR